MEERLVGWEAVLHPFHLLLMAPEDPMVRRQPGHGSPKRNHQKGGTEEEAAALALCLELGRLRPLSELAVIDELTWAFRLLLRRLFRLEQL